MTSKLLAWIIESMKLILAEIEKTFWGEGFMEVDQIMTSLRCPLDRYVG